MIEKKIVLKSEAQAKIIEAVTILADAVKVTLGPWGRTVLIESQHHISGMTATKDGVTVAESINHSDSSVDIPIRAIKEAARNTVKKAGDGTTTAIVLVEAIIKETLSRTHSGDNITEITRNIEYLTNQVIANLDKKSTKIVGDMLLHIATVSANNDSDLGKIIADAYEQVGEEGVVWVKDSRGYETTCEVSEGITFDRGYSDAFQITNEKGQSSELENPYILVTDRKIPNLQTIGNIMQEIISQKRPILIIGKLEKDAQDAFNFNIEKNVIRGANVIAPGFGWNSAEMLKDIAAVTGATFVSEKTGSDWQQITIADLGTADKVVVDRESTTISKENDTERMMSRLEDLRAQLESAKTDDETKAMENRIANLCGKVATITVGGTTPMEQKERKDRVDDAVLATKAAMEEGALAGGGIALLEESYMSIPHCDRNMVIAADILSAAMKAPFNQILINADMTPEEVSDKIDCLDTDGFNVKTGEYGDMFEMGIIDPAKVTKTALKNGSAVARTLLMSSVIITNVREGDFEREQLKFRGNSVKARRVKVRSTSILWGMFKFNSRNNG